MDAPTALELLAQPLVQQALDGAWVNSCPLHPDNRHEEGGWIYLNPTTGEIRVERATSGSQAAIDLNNPPIPMGFLVVGKFHTHPNPAAEGWVTGPSQTDLNTDAFHGVPDLIRAEDGIHLSGPDRRRGGLVGDPGYPS